MTRRIIGLCAGLVAAGICLPVQADHVQILLERHKGKNKKVVILRQILDMGRGFDQYYLEEFAAPDNKRVSRVELADGKRGALASVGHFELYMKKVAEDRAGRIETFKKKDYLEVCNLGLFEHPELNEFELESAGRKVKLRLVYGRYQSIELVAGKDNYRLMRFVDGGTRSANEVELARRALVQVALINKGRMLVVVVRKYLYPSPPHTWEDEFFFFPLKRATKRLGLTYPLECDQCNASVPGKTKDTDK